MPAQRVATSLPTAQTGKARPGGPRGAGREGWVRDSPPRAGIAPLIAGSVPRRLLLGAGLVLAAWLTWPVLSVAPGPGLDPAYGYGLTEAARQGLASGSQIVFTYGPLGFLTAPSLWWAPAAAGALAVTAVVHLAWCSVVWIAARRHLPLLGAAAAFVALMWLSTLLPANQTGDAAEMLALTLAVAALLLLERRPNGPVVPAAVAVGSVAAAFTVLAKFDSGLLAVGVVAVAAAGLCRRWWAGLAGALGATGASIVVLWVAAGQPLADLRPWLERAVVMTLGWGDALRYEAPGTAWQYPAAALLAAAVLTVLWAGRSRSSVASWLVVGGVLLVGFKHGFVRHDAHVVWFFIPVAALLLALPPVGRRVGVSGAPSNMGPSSPPSTAGLSRSPSMVAPSRSPSTVGSSRPPSTAGSPAPPSTVGSSGRLSWVSAAWLASTVSALVVLGVVGSTVRPSFVQLAQGSADLVGEVDDLVSPARTAAVQSAGRAEIRAADPLPDAVLALLAGRGVQVEPYDTSLAWAYGLRWHPTPIFQTNMIDEASLDRLMAASLAGPGAPGAILRRRGPDVEDVPQPWDGPAYRLAELCDYRLAYQDADWDLLLRAAPRCGGAVTLATETVQPGRPVPVPAAPPGKLVTAAFRLPAPGLAVRLQDLLYKPSTSLRFSAGAYSGTVYRAVAGDPLVVYVPAAYDAGGDWPEARFVTLTGFTGLATVTFSAVPIGP